MGKLLRPPQIHAMVTIMSLAKGSIAPQKVKSPVVREIAALFKQVSEAELLLLRGLLMAELVARDAEGSALYQDSLRNQCVVALDRSDLRCRLADDHGLVTMADYNRHKDTGDPSASWIARAIGGGCWIDALSEAGIGTERYLEPILIRGSGARTRPGGGEAWSLGERVEALALAIDRQYGYDVTKEAWEHYRDIVPFETPCYPTLLGKRSKDGKLIGGCTLSEMHDLARKLIFRAPERFPVAAARLRLVAAVRTKEAKRTPARQRKAA